MTTGPIHDLAHHDHPESSGTAGQRVDEELDVLLQFTGSDDAGNLVTAAFPGGDALLGAAPPAVATEALSAPGVLPATAPPGGTPVVIIGSGYGGAVVAHRLAQRGIPATVLERGRRWPITAQGDTFATPVNPDGRAAWLSTTSPFTNVKLNKFPGVLETYAGNGITVMAGAGVGGGSLVNNAVVLEPSKELFEHAFGNTLPYQDFKNAWFPRALELLGATRIPQDVLDSEWYTAARSFAAEATEAGLPPLYVDMAVDWDVVRAEMKGTRVRSFVLGQSTWGVNSGARLSLDLTLLAEAEGTGLTRVVTGMNVIDVVSSGGGYLVTADVIDDRGEVAGRRSFPARTVVFAAGSLNTNRLLVRLRDTHRLPKLKATIGQGWGNNGDNVSVRAGMPPNNPTCGGPSGVVVRDWSDTATATTLLNFPWGKPPMADKGAIGTLGVAPVPAVGAFTYQAATDSAELTWPAVNPAVQATTTCVNKVLDRFNKVTEGSFTGFTNPGSTAHPLGGVRIGRDCTDRGALHDNPGLWVVDSSLVPGSSGAVPPVLTITAIADRCADAIVGHVGGGDPANL